MNKLKNWFNSVWGPTPVESLTMWINNLVYRKIASKSEISASQIIFWSSLIVIIWASVACSTENDKNDNGWDQVVEEEVDEETPEEVNVCDTLTPDYSWFVEAFTPVFDWETESTLTNAPLWVDSDYHNKTKKLLYALTGSDEKALLYAGDIYPHCNNIKDIQLLNLTDEQMQTALWRTWGYGWRSWWVPMIFLSWLNADLTPKVDTATHQAYLESLIFLIWKQIFQDDYSNDPNRALDEPLVTSLLRDMFGLTLPVLLWVNVEGIWEEVETQITNLKRRLLYGTDEGSVMQQWIASYMLWIAWEEWTLSWEQYLEALGYLATDWRYEEVSDPASEEVEENDATSTLETTARTLAVEKFNVDQVNSFLTAMTNLIVDSDIFTPLYEGNIFLQWIEEAPQTQDEAKETVRWIFCQKIWSCE